MNPEQEAFDILHDKAGELFDIETMEAEIRRPIWFSSMLCNIC